MVLSDYDKRILILFNDTANKAIHSKFYQESKEKTISLTVHHQYDKDLKHTGRTFEVEHHTPEFIDSVIIPLRLFFLDRDNISFKKLSELYHKLDISSEYIKKYDKARNSINKFLESPAMTVYEDKPTNLVLFNTIVYGDLFHKEPQKIELLKKWKSDQISWNLLYLQFQQILYKLIQTAELIVGINELILNPF